MGDIQAKTGHLSLAEFGAYDRLLDHYYATEQGLPGDLDACCRIARAMSRDERKAVESVLMQFFTLTGALYTQGRTEEMIAEARPKIAAAKANGAKGGRPKKNPAETRQKPTGFPKETQDEPSSIPSQNQNHSSLRSEDVAQARALDAIPAKLLADYGKVRSAKRAGAITETVIAGLQREAGKAGLTLQQAITACCEFGWQGFNAEWYASRTAGMAKPANTHKYAAAAKAIFEDDDERRTVNA